MKMKKKKKKGKKKEWCRYILKQTLVIGDVIFIDYLLKYSELSCNKIKERLPVLNLATSNFICPVLTFAISLIFNPPHSYFAGASDDVT